MMPTKISSFSFVFLLICLIVTCIRCKENCEFVKTGDVALNPISKTFVPYQEGTNLVLKNEANETMTFIATREERADNRHCVQYLCEAFSDPFQPVPCEYFEGESVRNILRSDNDTLLLDILVSTENYEEESTLFYEVLSVYFSGIGALADAQQIVNVQFDSPSLDTSQTIVRNPFVQKSAIVLLGQSFTDVLQSAMGDDMIFYKKDKGLIGLKIRGDLWVLEE